MWILLVLAYGLIKGAREIIKKKALTKSSVIEVLVFYTFLSFLMVLPESGKSFFSPPDCLWLIAIKSFVIFCAWILSFKAIRRMPISSYGVLDLSRVLFATLLGIVVLDEKMGLWQIAGLCLVSAGLVMLPMGETILQRRQKRMAAEETGNLIRQGSSIRQEGGEPEASALKKPMEERTPIIYTFIAVLSCMLNSVSGLLDKLLMRDGTLGSGELQFWYMLFLLGFYVIYALISRSEIHWKNLLKNQWIWILSILFVLADRALFIANASPDSKVTVMTLIKQSGCLITILGGKFIFKEKNIGHKLLCAVVILAGIVVAVL